MKQILKKILLFVNAIAIFTACGDGTSSGVSSNGTLVKGEFTVAQGKKVYFSQGNLQYQPSTGTWRFAEHQWDMIGKNNENISSNYDGWIDLFGWGTSGYNGKHPYMTSQNDKDYGDRGNDIAGTSYDWGVYNKISNGGNKAGMWRTLTESEWNYILNVRPHCNNLYSKGCVDGINGLILLPDEWNYSVGFSPRSKEYKTNDYTLDEWSVMESHGAVFLPAAGFHFLGKMEVSTTGFSGNYWSSSGGILSLYLHFRSDNIYTRIFNSPDYVYILTGRRDSRRSVRLVQDVK